MSQFIVLTDHALSRCAQRNLSIDDICYAIEYGQCIHRAGVTAYFLGAKNIPACDRRQQRYQQLVGLLVLTVEEEDEIVVKTVYRNRKNGLKEHRCKTKYNLHQQPAA